MTKFISEECYNDIMEMAAQMVAEAIINELKDDGYNFIATGCTKENGGTLYKVHTTHDKGVTKSKLYAKSPEDALNVIRKGYGGPDSAHKIVEAIINELHPDTIKSLQAKRERAVRVTDDAVHDADISGNTNKLDQAIGQNMEAHNKLEKARKAITKWAKKHPEVPQKTTYGYWYEPTGTKLVNEPRYSNEKPDKDTLVYKH